jgi:hypothetical protein
MSSNIKILNNEVKNINKEIDNIILKLKEIKKKNNKILNIKINKTNKNIKRGLQKEILVPKKICNFLSINFGTKLAKPKVQKMIYNIMKSRKLYYSKDKRVLRIDNELQKLFDINMDVNNSVNPKDKWGFNIYNFNKYLSKLYK